MEYQTVLSEVESWPTEDRIRLVQEVLERLLDRGPEAGLSDELKAELDRRVEEMDRNPGGGVPWEVVKARAIERFRR